MGLIEWWAGLNWKIRVLIPLILIAISTILLFLGRIWFWGWAAGFILLMFSGRSKSEKNGYNF